MADELDVKAVVAAALAERDAADKAKAEAAVALKASEGAGYKKAVDEFTAKKMLKIAPAVVKEIGDDNDGVQAFTSWIKTGEVNAGLIQGDETKVAYNVTTGAAGAGFLVPDPLLQTIQPKRDLLSWVRQAPVQSFSTPADHILVPVEGTKATSFVQTNEAGTYDENEPTFNAIDIILYKYTKRVLMSEEFVTYNQTNFDAWLSNALGRAVGTLENTIFSVGPGGGAPQGIRSGATTTGTVAGSSLTAVAALDLSYLIGLLPAGYNVPSECGFLMRNVTKWLVKGVSSLPFPFMNGPQNGADFFGYPCYVSDDVPVIGTASATGAIIFANFTQYGIAEKPGIIIQRNPYLYMQTGQIALFANVYRGGAALQGEAIVLSLNHA